MTMERGLKRLLDFLATLVFLLLFWPLLLGIALAVKLDGPGGVIFRQPRVGLNGQLFTIYKFRSMKPHPVDYDDLPEVRVENPYLTCLGRWLRQYGLDELPQVFNILRGEMSFVGPRPTIPEQVAQYSPLQRRRLEVRPGLTGLAQVSGNTFLPWEERIRLDIWYIDHWSLWLDARILYCTVRVVFNGQVMGPAEGKLASLPSLDVHQIDQGTGQGVEAG